MNGYSCCVYFTALQLLRLLYGTTAVAFCRLLSLQPHTLLGSALGLLLVFRTNAAYQRFQEGRKLWEQLLNVSRDIARMSHLYENGEIDRQAFSRNP